MKKIILPIFIFILTGSIININAQAPDQPAAPTVSDAPVLRDDEIRLRSVELERIRREARRKKSDESAVNTDLDQKYPEIKEDFEGIQMRQSEIVEAYTKSGEIDYKTIETSAGEIKKHAKRLDENLFSTELKIKEEKSGKKGDETKEIKDLIVDLDNAIGAFISSSMFQNLRVVDPEVAKKTQKDLMEIVRLSDELADMADKMN